MEISGKVYSERKEAGAAIIEACKALKAAGTEGRIGSYGAFELHSRFDNFDKVFRLSIKGAWNYSMEVGKDPQGNILRVTNALAGIERTLLRRWNADWKTWNSSWRRQRKKPNVLLRRKQNWPKNLRALQS